ncbi:MAG: hypothetical protein F6K24_49175 [Okeania sp. SIO2D1]|nr:hypothetical protein [Okeania sp. SIO2D1]
MAEPSGSYIAPQLIQKSCIQKSKVRTAENLAIGRGGFHPTLIILNQNLDQPASHLTVINKRSLHFKSKVKSQDIAIATN